MSLDRLFALGARSTTALLGGDSRETYLRLMREAKEAGRFVSCAP